MFVITRTEENGRKTYLGKDSKPTRIIWKGFLENALTFATLQAAEKSGFDMRGLVTGVNIERLG